MQFPHGVIEFQLLLLFVLIGTGSASVYASASYMPAFHAYLTPAVAPVGVMMLREGDTVHTVLATMTLFYIPVTMRFAQNLNRSLRESIALRFENLGLIARLREQADMAERADVAKSRILAAASHDLRQPMHALTLSVELLRRGELAPSHRSTVDNIVRAANALGFCKRNSDLGSFSFGSLGAGTYTLFVNGFGKTFNAYTVNLSSFSARVPEADTDAMLFIGVGAASAVALSRTRRVSTSGHIKCAARPTVKWGRGCGRWQRWRGCWPRLQCGRWRQASAASSAGVA